MGRALDLTGQRFGRLIALYKAPSKNRKTYWHCKCDCGVEKDMRTDWLTSGAVVSCGCYMREVAAEHAKKIGHDCGLDLRGRVFGYLHPIEKTEKRKNRHIVWRCYCSNCGSECEVSMLYLQRGNTISCGCISRSNGEQKIFSLLKENNIIFEEQKRFETCLFPKTKRPARFDFYVDNKYLIEYQGEQHYREDNPWYNKERDDYKKQWCEENNIPLICVPYTKLETLTLEDLMLETSPFLEKTIKNLESQS